MSLVETSVLLKNSIWKVIEVERGLVLIDGSFRQRIDLNDTAAVIWRLIDGARSCRDIYDLLADAYGRDVVTKGDVFDVFNYLIDHHLVMEIL